MIRLQRGTLEVEGDRRGCRIGRDSDGPPEPAEVIRVDLDELRWLTLTALPAIIVAPGEDEPLHQGGNPATVTDDNEGSTQA